jgi:hypothetical protein
MRDEAVGASRHLLDDRAAFGNGRVDGIFTGRA